MVQGQRLQGLSDHVRMFIPQRSSLNKCLQRAKNKANPEYPIPVDKSFEIPEEFSDFVLHDSGTEDPHRILALGSPALVDALFTANLWLADGTFKIVQEIFFQLYTLHFKLATDVTLLLYTFFCRTKQGKHMSEC